MYPLAITIWFLQSFMYEVSCSFEVETEVKVLGILCRDSAVDTCIPVKTLLTEAALLGVSCVQDVGDAQCA